MTTNAQSTCTKFVALLLLFAVFGCKEFYDEDFEEDLRAANQESGGGNGGGNVRYRATIVSADPNYTSISGTSVIEVNGDSVKIDVDAQGIPENLLQLHYSFLAAPCSTIGSSLPIGTGGSKSIDISETSTLNSLREDIATSGASRTPGDINLADKSFVIKGFPSINTASTGTSGTAVILACGDLDVSNEETNTTGTNTNTTTGTTGFPDTTTGTTGFPDTTTGTTGFPDTTGTTGFPDTTGTTGFPDTTGTTGFPDTTGTTGFPDTTGTTGFPDTTTGFPTPGPSPVPGF